MLALEIADRLEILELVSRYAHAADRSDEGEFSRLFTDDAQFQGRDRVIEGALNIGQYQAKQIAAYRAKGLISSHFMLNSMVELNGDQASHTCKLLVCVVKLDRSAMTVGSTGKYTDRLVRTAAGWRFKSRRVEADVHFWRRDQSGYTFDLPFLQ